MQHLPTLNEVRDMQFSSLACRIHDWIHSPTRSVINKTQKTQCAAMIGLLEQKLQAGQLEAVSRGRVVERLKKDLEGLLTYAMATATKSKSAAASRL